ncbi:MAG: hypothetical protein QNJ63_03520 [Calothrix sp. MO_192.B10]|nr:hypothetical protein [Calothrix sp. MO_192.B10]
MSCTFSLTAKTFLPFILLAKVLICRSVINIEHEENFKFDKKQMDILIDAELSIEHAHRIVQSEPQLFKSENSENTELKLEESLDSIKEYLDEIIDEYEKSYRLFSDGVAFIRLSQFPKLCNFVGSKKQAHGSNAKFWKPIHDVLDILGKVLQS